MGALGILAGGGALPRRLIAACRATGRACFVVAFDGQTDAETVAAVPHAWNRLGAAGATLDHLRAAGCADVVMAGTIKRPSIAALAPDLRGAALLARIGWRAVGDDGMLRAVAAELDKEGFRVVSPLEVLADLAALAGVWGRVAPEAAHMDDIARGADVARVLGQADVGQAVVVQQGLVLAVEAIEGTDALVRRSAALAQPGQAPVLVKRAKPQQDRRLDPPVIGPQTVAVAAASGFAGLAVEAGTTLVVDRPATIAAADQTGLFLFGFESAWPASS